MTTKRNKNYTWTIFSVYCIVAAEVWSPVLRGGPVTLVNSLVPVGKWGGDGDCCCPVSDDWPLSLLSGATDFLPVGVITVALRQRTIVRPHSSTPPSRQLSIYVGSVSVRLRRVARPTRNSAVIPVSRAIRSYSRHYFSTSLISTVHHVSLLIFGTVCKVG